MSDSILIRDFINPNIIDELAVSIKTVYVDFDQDGFLFSTLTGLEEQTYSERRNNVTNALIEYLPDNFPEAIAIILAVIPPEYETDVLESTVSRFYIAALTAYISKMGIGHFEISMDALYRITKSFTSEFDIRPFLLKYPEESLELLHKWAYDKNPHVRRLVSEGSRPNLPWGKKLKFVVEDPKNTTVPLLTILQDDPSEYVRKSVANHLNDFSKTSPDLVVKHLAKWQKQNPTKEKQRMISHALRSLVKSGHLGALALLGYDDDFDIDLSFHDYDKEVQWGDKFNFEFTLKNNRPDSKKLMVDYIIGYQKKTGTISDKVFKLKKLELAGNKSFTISKKQSFKAITTRIYYPGEHTLAIQVNGRILGKVSFELMAE